jgi:hypothetical protein
MFGNRTAGFLSPHTFALGKPEFGNSASKSDN